MTEESRDAEAPGPAPLTGQFVNRIRVPVVDDSDFDLPTKRDILRRVQQVMAPDGYLFLGAAEMTMGSTTPGNPFPQDVRRSTESKGTQMRAQAIDDSRTMRRIIAHTLQGAGFDVAGVLA